MSIDETPTDELTRRLRADARQLDECTRSITIADIDARRAAVTTWPTPVHVKRARPAVALTLAAVLSIAAIVAWNTSRSTNSSAPRRVQVTTPSTDGTSPSASESVHAEQWRGAPFYLEPTYVPAGFSLVSWLGPGVGGANQAGSPEVTASQSWVRFDAAHDAATATLDIQWGPGALAHGANGRPVSTDPLAGWRPGSVAVTVQGRSGLYSPRLSGVAWEEPAGQAVSVDCEKCSRVEIVQIADELVRRADGGFAWPAPHDGFEFVNQAPGMRSLGKNVRELTYRGPAGTGFMIVIADDTDEPPFSQLGLPNLQIVDVRDTRGVIGPQLNAPVGLTADIAFMAQPTLAVQWLEYPNVAITVVGKNVSRTDLLAIANGLREIDAQHRAALGGSASP